MHFNALPNRDGLLILWHICNESASTKSTEISWELVTVLESHWELWGYPPTAVLSDTSPRTVTLRATQSFVPHALLSLKSSKRATTTQRVSQMPPYCDCLSPGKEINGQMASLWLSRMETACSDTSETAHAPVRATPSSLRQDGISHLVALTFTAALQLDSSSGETAAPFDLLHHDTNGHQGCLKSLCEENGVQHTRGYFSLELWGWEWKQVF